MKSEAEEIRDYYEREERRNPTKGDWQIAKITETFIGYEDHGHLTIILRLNYGGTSQGAGNYDLGTRAFDSKGELDRWIKGCLRACGVDEWNKIRGRTIMALSEEGLVRAIKPLPTESGSVFWFNKDRE